MHRFKISQFTAGKTRMVSLTKTPGLVTEVLPECGPEGRRYDQVVVQWENGKTSYLNLECDYDDAIQIIEEKCEKPIDGE